MSAERAKIFAPFAALRGHGELLRAAEKVKVEKKTLAEDRTEEINEILHTIARGTPVEVEYYTGDDYVKKCGLVDKLGDTFLVIDGQRIDFCDVFDVKTYR